MDQIISLGQPRDRFSDQSKHAKVIASLREEMASISIQQLRHHTNNALQSLLLQIEQSSCLKKGRSNQLEEDLQRRILLSVQISNSLFGLTRAPGTLDARLERLGRAVIALHRSPSQAVELAIDVTVALREPLAQYVVRIAYEMLGNVMKHGICRGRQGKILLGLHGDAARGVCLKVLDDGIGLKRGRSGQGMGIMETLASHYGGVISLQRQEGWTAASLMLPPAVAADQLLTETTANCGQCST